MELVSELMTPTPQVVPADTPIGVAAKILLRLGFRHLLVVRDGALCGVVTDWGLFRHGGFVGAQGELWVPFSAGDAPLTVAEVMIVPEIVCGPDAALLPILRRLSRSSQDVVAVVDSGGLPIGILTEHDAVRLALALIPPQATAVENGSWPLRTVTGMTPAAQALEKMSTHRIRHLVVVDDDHTIRGVLSLADLLADGAGMAPDLVSEDCVRAHRLVTVPEGTSLRNVAQLMVRHRIGCVPILNDRGRPIAVVTRTDIVEALVAGLEQEQLFPSD